ncbi:MAG: hypothetical protein R6W82_04380 [bacterium]
MPAPPAPAGDPDRPVRWLDRLRRRQAAVDLAGGLATGIAAALVFLTLLAVADGLLVLTRPLRAGGLAAALLLLASPPLLAARRAAGRGRREAARQAEGLLPGLRRQLSLAESLEGGRLPAGTSPRMAREAAFRAGALLEEVPCRAALRTDPLRRGVRHSGRALLLPAAALLLLPGVLGAGAGRLVRPAADHRAAHLPELVLEHERLSVEEGRGVRIRALLRSGPMPREAEVLWNPEGSDFWRPERMEAIAPGTLAADLTPGSSGRYYVRTPRTRTGEGTLLLLRRPFPDSLQVRVRAPAYTGGGERTLPSGLGDVEVLPGSRVTVRTWSQVPLAGAWLRLEDAGGGGSRELPMELASSGSGHAGTASFRVGGPGSWSLGMEARNGLRLEEPVRFAVRVREDRPPRVDLLEPASDGDLTEEMLLPLVAAASDDIQVDRIGWAWRVVDRREEGVRWMAEPGRPAVRGQTVWDLAGIDLMPGDRMEVWAVAEDNDPYGGPNRGESARRMLRLPTLVEAAAAARQRLEGARRELVGAAGRRAEAAGELEDLLRRLRAAAETGREDLDWEGQQAVEEVVEAQAAVEEAIERAASAADEALRDLGARRALSARTREKLQAVREAMDRVMTAGMRESMERLRGALEQLDAAGTLSAAEQGDHDLQTLGRELERLLDLLETVEADQQLDVLAAAATDAAARQEAVAGVAEADPDWGEETARRQAYVASTQTRIRQMLAETAGALAARSPGAAGVLEETAVRADSLRLDERLAELARRMQTREGPDPAPAARRAAADLAGQARRVEEARRAARQGESEELGRLFERTAADLLQVAGIQQAVAERRERAPRDSLLRTQGELGRAARRAADRLERGASADPFEAPRVGEAVDRALRRIEETARAMQEDGPWAPRAAEAGASLNGAALLALKAAESARGAPSSGSGPASSRLGDALARAVESQARLVEEAAGMGGAGRDEMSMEERAAAERLAAGQRDLGEELRRLEAERGEEQVLGDLEALAREMEEVADELRERGAPPDVVERQERILSRLLDAGRALRSRPSEGGREAERARGYVPADPGELSGRGPDPLEAALRRVLEEGYRIEYERLIRRYFQRLRERRSGGGGR